MKLLSSPSATLPTRLQEAYQASTGQVTKKGGAGIYVPKFYLKTRFAHDQYGPKTGPFKREGAVST